MSVWQRMIAPSLSATGLIACLVLMVANLALVSGSGSFVVDSFPALLALIGTAGFGYAMWLRTQRPLLYQQLGQAFE
jgi:hypothetical protein